ncbi:hypothetical protein ACE01N_09625 [Saccharicrinis sp. FJH2]|uniref:hypothetical protein n=1 Tax=Saccharicrinis sp. FJH65 TaxID=3344659 RepID=UPI0035F29711
MKDLIIVGGYGSGEIAAQVFCDINNVKKTWNIVGYLNDIINPGDYLGKHKVVGATNEIQYFIDKGYYIHYTLHYNAKHKLERTKKLKGLKIPEEQLATGIHPLAYVNPESTIGNGVLMLPYSSTSVGVEVQNNVHIYAYGFLGHDSKVRQYSTITAKSIVGGRVIIGEGAHVGLNSSIREDVKIGEYAIIGMGSIVLKNVASHSVVVGNPAKQINITNK